MTLEDVDHLEAPRMIAEEDHITLERKAANVGAQLGSRPAYRSFERSQRVTLPAQIPHESLCGGDAAALFGNIAKNFREDRRVRKRGTSPASRAIASRPQLHGLGGDGRIEFVVRNLAAGCDRRLDLLTERRELRFALLDETQPLAHDFARRAITPALDNAFDETFPSFSDRHVHCAGLLAGRRGTIPRIVQIMTSAPAWAIDRGLTARAPADISAGARGSADFQRLDGAVSQERFLLSPD